MQLNKNRYSANAARRLIICLLRVIKRYSIILENDLGTVVVESSFKTVEKENW